MVTDALSKCCCRPSDPTNDSLTKSSSHDGPGQHALEGTDQSPPKACLDRNFLPDGFHHGLCHHPRRGSGIPKRHAGSNVDVFVERYRTDSGYVVPCGYSILMKYLDLQGELIGSLSPNSHHGGMSGILPRSLHEARPDTVSPRW